MEPLRFLENKCLAGDPTDDLREETPAVVLDTGEAGGGGAVRRGCHPTA